MVFDRFEDFLKFYKRYDVYVGFIVFVVVLLGRITRRSIGNNVCPLKKDFVNLQRRRKWLRLLLELCPKQGTNLKGEN